MTKQAKVTPYWHPPHPVSFTRRYSAMSRTAAADLLREFHRERAVYRSRDVHGALWYVLDRRTGFESGRVFIPLRSR